MAGEAAATSLKQLVILSCVALLYCTAHTAALAEQPGSAGEQDHAGRAALDETSVANSYPLGPGDMLEVRVLGEESVSRAFSGQFLIEADGTVNYPIVGTLQVGGTTIGQVAQLIKETVGAVAPLSGMPFVRVAEHAPVYVVGDVARTGPYAFRPALTVMQLVLRAGGLAQAPDLSSRINALRSEVEDLKIVGFSLTVQRSRLLAELGDDQFTGELTPRRPVMNQDMLDNETALFGARRRERQSQVESYEAQRRTYAKEIGSLEQTITLHDKELDLLRERYAGLQSLAERGLAPKSQLLDARRELLGLERQGLEFRTALVRANQGRLAITRQLDDVKVGTEVRNRQSLSEVELNLARNRSRLAAASAALANLVQPQGPRSMLGPHADYKILRSDGLQFEVTTADEFSLLQRGDILRVEFGFDAPSAQGRAGPAAKAPVAFNRRTAERAMLPSPRSDLRPNLSE
jgi:polysaccharide export outer membrane protein